jgi:hypothetical protein
MFLEVESQLKCLHFPNVHLLCFDLGEMGTSERLTHHWLLKVLYVSSHETLFRTSSGYFYG